MRWAVSLPKFSNGFAMAATYKIGIEKHAFQFDILPIL
jgi:hypothetical protein